MSGNPNPIEVAGLARVGCFYIRIFGREIRVVAYVPDDHDQ